MRGIDYWRSKVKAYLRDYVMENTGLKVLALMITAVIWLSVASRPVREVTLLDIPITFPKAPTLTITKYGAQSARVTLRGPSDVVDLIRASDLSLIGEVGAVEPGVRVIQLKLDRGNLPNSVEELRIEPLSVRVTVERVLEKEVPVKPRFDGEPPSGYEIVRWEVKPETITIAGGASLLKDVNEVSTETVTLTNLTAPISEQVAIDLGSPNITISGDRRNVTLTIEIREVRIERVIDDIPVVLVDAPANARSVPRSVRLTVAGPRSAVAIISASDFSVSAAYPEHGRALDRIAPEASVLRNSDRVQIKSIEPKFIRIR